MTVPEGFRETRYAELTIALQPDWPLDVTPTVLGLIGRPYETMFFGRDLLKTKAPAADGRVFINHNRDIGLT